MGGITLKTELPSSSYKTILFALERKRKAEGAVVGPYLIDGSMAALVCGLVEQLKCSYLPLYIAGGRTFK